MVINTLDILPGTASLLGYIWGNGGRPCIILWILANTLEMFKWSQHFSFDFNIALSSHIRFDFHSSSHYPPLTISSSTGKSQPAVLGMYCNSPKCLINGYAITRLSPVSSRNVWFLWYSLDNSKFLKCSAFCLIFLLARSHDPRIF